MINYVFTSTFTPRLVSVVGVHSEFARAVVGSGCYVELEVLHESPSFLLCG